MRSDSLQTYKIGISLTPGITAEAVRGFTSSGLDLKDFFELPMAELAQVAECPELRLQKVDREEALQRARMEEEFVERHNINCIFLTDEDYPVLLRETPDAPVLLYVLGTTDLNLSPAVAMVGTRRCTAYGLGFCDSFVDAFAPYFPEAAIVSGLALGIDGASHTAALRNNLTTFAVLAHGLDTIYPAQHRDLARTILAAGGALISEYPSGTRPFRGNFLQRNRIVAGMSEATIVVESEIRGGAMSTANLAFHYNREVYALPGRCTDRASEGTNMLIARNKARIYTSFPDMMREMNWPVGALMQRQAPEKNLFPELDGDARIIYTVLTNNNGPMAVDELHMATGLSVSSLMANLTELEFDGIIAKLPGARYEIR